MKYIVEINCWDELFRTTMDLTPEEFVLLARLSSQVIDECSSLHLFVVKVEEDNE